MVEVEMCTPVKICSPLRLALTSPPSPLCSNLLFISNTIQGVMTSSNFSLQLVYPVEAIENVVLYFLFSSFISVKKFSMDVS